jgi:DNA-directed RNA polymerase III subunit RPC6
MVGPGGDDGDAAESKTSLYKDSLYEECKSRGGADQVYTQRDLLDFEIIPNREVKLLVQVVQLLVDDNLLIPCRGRDQQLSFRWREKQDAVK